MKVREAQFMCFHSPMAAELSAEIIRAKVRNERAVLLYFAKGMRGRSDDRNEILSAAAGNSRTTPKGLRTSRPMEPTARATAGAAGSWASRA